jgi:hypothetical protein
VVKEVSAKFPDRVFQLLIFAVLDISDFPSNPKKASDLSC